MKKNLKKNNLIQLFIVAFLLIATILSVVCISPLLKNEEKSTNGNVSTVNSDKDKILIGTDTGKIYFSYSIDKPLDLIADFDTKIIDLKVLSSGSAAITDDRRVLIFDENGNIENSISLNYPLTKIEVFNDIIYVLGSQTTTRTRIYALDNNLNLLDLTNGEHTEQGVNESDSLFLERTHALSLDFPVISFKSLNSKEFAIVSDYSIFSIYKDGNEVLQTTFDYTPTAVEFLEEKFYFADVNSKLSCYDYEGNSLFSIGTSQILSTIEEIDNNLFCTSKYGFIAAFDENGKTIWSLNLKEKIIYAGFSNDLAIFGFEETKSVLIFSVQNLKLFSFFTILKIVLWILIAILTIWTFIMLSKFYFPKLQRKIFKSAKEFGVGVYRSKWALLALSPAILLALVFAYYPAISGFALAFFEIELDGANTFVGMQNFIDLMNKPFFWKGMGNMLTFLLTDLLKALIPAFLFAELLIAMRSRRTQYITRVLLYLPGIIPGVAVMLIWKDGIFGMNGVVNNFLSVFKIDAVNWLGDDKTALSSLILMGFPWIGSYIILYGALMSVPTSYYEAAKLDGCSWFKRLITIDIPMISPQLKYIFVLSFIGSIQDFQRVFLTTEGAFGTYVPMLEMYYNLTVFNNYGMAAAMCLVLFLVMMVATLLNLKIKTVDGID